MCAEVLEVGFSKEDLLYALVAVEEIPVTHIHTAVAEYVSGITYNIKKCGKDEFLLTCFREPHNAVWHMLLGHNHMMLVMRAFLTQA